MATTTATSAKGINGFQPSSCISYPNPFRMLARTLLPWTRGPRGSAREFTLGVKWLGCACRRGNPERAAGRASGSAAGDSYEAWSLPAGFNVWAARSRSTTSSERNMPARLTPRTAGVMAAERNWWVPSLRAKTNATAISGVRTIIVMRNQWAGANTSGDPLA
jgi:hypothetical protein